MKLFKKIKDSMTSTATYSRPILHLRFVNGEEITIRPHLWHLDGGHWKDWYLEDGLIVGRYPLASIIEVYEVSCEHKDIKYDFDPMHLPFRIADTYMEYDNLSMKRRGWDNVKIFSEKNEIGG